MIPPLTPPNWTKKPRHSTGCRANAQDRSGHLGAPGPALLSWPGWWESEGIHRREWTLWLGWGRCVR